MRERRKREQLELLATERGPKSITWHCGCGAAIVVYENRAADFSAWLDHRRACLFARAAYPVAVALPSAAAGGAP